MAKCLSRSHTYDTMTLKQIKEVEELGFDRVRIGAKTYAIVGFVKEKGNITYLNVLNSKGGVVGIKFPVKTYEDEVHFYNSEKSPVKNRNKDQSLYSLNYSKRYS